MKLKVRFLRLKNLFRHAETEVEFYIIQILKSS